MKPKDIVRVAVRIVGLLGIVYVVRHLARLIHKNGSPHLDDPLLLIGELALILAGFYMLRGAPLIMKFMFPEESDSSDDQPRNQSGSGNP